MGIHILQSCLVPRHGRLATAVRAIVLLIKSFLQLHPQLTHPSLPPCALVSLPYHHFFGFILEKNKLEYLKYRETNLIDNKSQQSSHSGLDRLILLSFPLPGSLQSRTLSGSSAKCGTMHRLKPNKTNRKTQIV